MPSTFAQPASETRKTPWGLVLLAIGAGILAGVQIGKAHIALPSIRSSFSLSLVDASWILSALSFVGMLIAAPSGSIAARLGNRKTVAIGLFIMAIASACGGIAPNVGLLIFTRVVEGLGSILIVVAAPSLIVEVTERRHIGLALAGWSTFIPGGVALATLLAPPLLAHHTWRAVWLVDAVVVAGYALFVLFMPSPRAVATRRPISASGELHPLGDLKAVITSRGPLLLAIIFAMYTTQHLGIMGFMPTVLIENYGVAPAHAGVLISIAMASNILGNLSAGVLLQKGARRSMLIGGATIFMALMTVGIFSAHLPLTGAYLCCFFFSCVGGIVPSSVLSAAPFQSPSTRLIPATNGLLAQGSNLGMVIGPLIVGAIVSKAGWQWVPALTITAAIAATMLAIIVSRGAQSPLANLTAEESNIPLH